jgi:hypothetical protein
VGPLLLQAGQPEDLLRGDPDLASKWDEFWICRTNPTLQAFTRVHLADRDQQAVGGAPQSVLSVLLIRHVVPPHIGRLDQRGSWARQLGIEA